MESSARGSSINSDDGDVAMLETVKTLGPASVPQVVLLDKAKMLSE